MCSWGSPIDRHKPGCILVLPKSTSNRLLTVRIPARLINIGMNTHQLKLRETQIEWMKENACHFTHAVTLTFKPYRTVINDRGQMRQTLTAFEARRSFRLFVNLLNTTMFGHAAKRFGKSVAVIPVLEGQAPGKLLHYHCAIGGFRAGMTEEQIRAVIVTLWRSTHFGNSQIDVTPMVTSGWIAYMGKEIGIQDADVVDWENVRLPAVSLA